MLLISATRGSHSDMDTPTSNSDMNTPNTTPRPKSSTPRTKHNNLRPKISTPRPKSSTPRSKSDAPRACTVTTPRITFSGSDSNPLVSDWVKTVNRSYKSETDGNLNSAKIGSGPLPLSHQRVHNITANTNSINQKFQPDGVKGRNAEKCIPTPDKAKTRIISGAVGDKKSPDSLPNENSESRAKSQPERATSPSLFAPPVRLLPSDVPKLSPANEMDMMKILSSTTHTKDKPNQCITKPQPSMGFPYTTRRGFASLIASMPPPIPEEVIAICCQLYECLVSMICLLNVVSLCHMCY